jgi:hypothetical protein
MYNFANDLPGWQLNLIGRKIHLLPPPKQTGKWAIQLIAKKEDLR